MKPLVAPLRSLLVSLAFAAAASDQSDVSGYYLLDADSRSAFEELHWLELWRVPVAPEPSRIALSGGLRLHEQLEDGKFVTLPLEDVSLDGKALSFRSGEWRGSHYRFEGSFTRRGLLRDVAKEAEVVLSGILEEVRDGMLLRRQEVSFAYTGGD